MQEASLASAPLTVVSNYGIPIEVRAGDVYVFLWDMETRAGHTHLEGTRIDVLEKTSETPHGEIGEKGYNWVCKTDFGVSVWATFEQCLARGLLRKVSP